MATFIGAIKGTEYDSLNYFNQSVLGVLKKEIKSMPVSKLRIALKDLESANEKFGKKATKQENLYNAAQRDIIKKEIKSRR
jgi:hypothetical protein